MNIGDRVKVVRIDDYTRDVCLATNTPTSIGKVGVITEIQYNHHMHQWDVYVEMEGSEYIWEPWNLSVIKEPGQ